MLNKWEKFFNDLGFRVSRWRIPKGNGKAVVPAPYIVLQKDGFRAFMADDRPYKIQERVTAILVCSPDDDASEKKVCDALWEHGYDFSGDEIYDYDMGVHVREFKFTDTVSYSDDMIY